MICLLGHKYTEIKGTIICERCGKEWHTKKEKENKSPAIIIKKEPLNLNEIFEDAKNNPIK